MVTVTVVCRLNRLSSMAEYSKSGLGKNIRCPVCTRIAVSLVSVEAV